MEKPVAIVIGALTFSMTVALNTQAQSKSQRPMEHMSGLLRLVETIPLPVDGYMDHLTVDVKDQRLFIAGEAAKSLLIIDLRAGKVIHETKGLAAMPKKPIYVPETNEVWTTLTNSTPSAELRMR